MRQTFFSPLSPPAFWDPGAVCSKWTIWYSAKLQVIIVTFRSWFFLILFTTCYLTDGRLLRRGLYSIGIEYFDYTDPSWSQLWRETWDSKWDTLDKDPSICPRIFYFIQYRTVQFSWSKIRSTILLCTQKPEMFRFYFQIVYSLVLLKRHHFIVNRIIVEGMFAFLKCCKKRNTFSLSVVRGDFFFMDLHRHSKVYALALELKMLINNRNWSVHMYFVHCPKDLYHLGFKFRKIDYKEITNKGN